MRETIFRNSEKREARTLKELMDAGRKTESMVTVNTKEALILIEAGARAGGVIDDPGFKTQRYSLGGIHFLWIAHNTDEVFPTNLKRES